MVVTIAPENPEVLPLGQQTAYEAGLSLQPHIFYFFLMAQHQHFRKVVLIDQHRAPEYP